MSQESRKDKVIFFGSGPVAAKSLELLANNFDIEAVVTKPKPAHHRGSFPVLDVAEELKLNIHTVSSKTELSALIAAKPFTSQVGVLIDFGIIVAQDTIDYFPKGIVNSHFSLLPEWRGADPITFSILSGQKQTGVSLMLLVQKMDEGPLLGQSEVTIAPEETTATLTEKLIDISYGLLQIVIPRWLEGSVEAGDQLEVSILVDNTPTYSRKLTKEDGRIDWNKPAEVLEREIRAYKEWPKSYTTIAGKDVIITKAHVVDVNHGTPGDIDAQQDIGLLMIDTAKGSLCIDNLKPAGKKEMTAKEFLSGYGRAI